MIEGLRDVPELSFQKVNDGCDHVCHLMPAQYDGARTGKTRNDLIRMLHDEYNIRCSVHYIPLYRVDLFKKMGCGKGHCPASERYFDNMLGYPWWSDMPDKLLDYFIGSTRAACARLRGGEVKGA